MRLSALDVFNLRITSLVLFFKRSVEYQQPLIAIKQ